jgi:hypothetical protein
VARRRPPVDLSEAIEGEVQQLATITTKLGDVLEAGIDKHLRPRKADEEQSLPDQDWVRCYRAYEMSVKALMEERRKNAAILASAGAGEPGAEVPLGDEEYQSTLDALLERRMSALTEEQLGRMMLDRMKNQEGQ